MRPETLAHAQRLAALPEDDEIRALCSDADAEVAAAAQHAARALDAVRNAAAAHEAGALDRAEALRLRDDREAVASAWRYLRGALADLLREKGR